MKAMKTLQDLLEEAKVRTVYWGLCIFAVSYFLTHTSKSMWANFPMAILFVAALRILFNEVEFRQKVRKASRQTYLSHLEKKQLSVNDSRLSTLPPPPKWKRKIDSPIIEAAMEEFIDKLLCDFVTDLWYSDITRDKEAPELIRGVIMDVLAEISQRVKEINLVDLLTRDIVDLIGDHLDLFRRNQAAIGVVVMGTLSSEERDERLKHHLMASNELHPALISPESEYKVLQRLISGLLAVVLRPREAQCPLVRCIARELVTCLVLQPIMSFASPEYVNELIEYIFLAIKDYGNKEAGNDQRSKVGVHSSDHVSAASIIPYGEFTLQKDASTHDEVSASVDSNPEVFGEETMYPQPAEWARVWDAANQRRTEVLMPENLENMWTKGRNYKRKIQERDEVGLQVPAGSGTKNAFEPTKDLGKKILTDGPRKISATEAKALVQLPPHLQGETGLYDGKNKVAQISHSKNMQPSVARASLSNELKNLAATANKCGFKRSNSTSALTVQPNMESTSDGGRPIISEFFSPDFGRNNKVHTVNSASDIVFRSEGAHNPKLRCQVIDVYFEKLGSKSFAVYLIAVEDADNNTWFVKRRS